MKNLTLKEKLYCIGFVISLMLMCSVESESFLPYLILGICTAVFGLLIAPLDWSKTDIKDKSIL